MSTWEIPWLVLISKLKRYFFLFGSYGCPQINSGVRAKCHIFSARISFKKEGGLLEGGWGGELTVQS